MPITKDDVEKIAALARLELTAEETESFTEQLGSILSHIEKLNELDTSAVEQCDIASTAEGDFGQALRDDLVRPSLGQRIATQNAPEADAGYFKVPKVIGG